MDKKLLVCPNCKAKFDVTYARTFSCGGCSRVISCNLVKCPKCGLEFEKT